MDVLQVQAQVPLLETESNQPPKKPRSEVAKKEASTEGKTQAKDAKVKPSHLQ